MHERRRGGAVAARPVRPEATHAVIGFRQRHRVNVTRRLPGRRSRALLPGGLHRPVRDQINAAKAICGRCSELQMCLSYAVRTAQDGIWGENHEGRTARNAVSRAPARKRISRHAAGIRARRCRLACGKDGSRSCTPRRPVHGAHRSNGLKSRRTATAVPRRRHARRHPLWVSGARNSARSGTDGPPAFRFQAWQAAGSGIWLRRRRSISNPAWL